MARDGFGDMAVSNAIGSNVFDIDLGLGLPFLIRSIIMKGKPILLLTKEQVVCYIAVIGRFLPEVIWPSGGSPHQNNKSPAS